MGRVSMRYHTFVHPPSVRLSVCPSVRLSVCPSPLFSFTVLQNASTPGHLSCFCLFDKRKKGFIQFISTTNEQQNDIFLLMYFFSTTRANCQRKTKKNGKFLLCIFLRANHQRKTKREHVFVALHFYERIVNEKRRRIDGCFPFFS